MRSVLKTGIIVVLLCAMASGAVAEWNTYRHDIRRSGVASDAMEVPKQELWQFKTRYKPQRAWPGPARRDGWHKSDPLKARMIFDWAYHVVMDEDTLYFGSSSDYKIYALDFETGEEKWAAYAEGPIRLAPTIHHGKVYFGSDDGLAYCLNKETGEELWRHKAAEDSYRLPGNSRIMSIAPVRSGVLVDDGIAYFSGGVFAYKGAYICAVSAQTGEALWKKKMMDAPQGYLLASTDKLYVPRGRVNPVVLNRDGGKVLYANEGSGGSFVVLADDYLFYGPGKTGQIDASRSDSRDHLVTMQGNQIVIHEGRAYMQTDTEMSCLDRKRYLELAEERSGLDRENDKLKEQMKRARSKKEEGYKEAIDEMIAKTEENTVKMEALSKDMEACLLWKVPCDYPYSLIYADGVLYAGGQNTIGGIDAETGETLWSAEVKGRALELACSGGKLVASTDEGVIHCFGQ